MPRPWHPSAGLGGDSKKKDEDGSRLHKIPISLGKPSLRLRLEAYYKLVAPDQISSNASSDARNASSWKARFEKIWDKFGGTIEGERKLATKLTKKYGTTVRFLTTEAAAASSPDSVLDETTQAVLSIPQKEESWFELQDGEIGSGDVSFTSNSFDPVAALMADPQTVAAENPWMSHGPPSVLDRVEQFRAFLPTSDPLHEVVVRKRKRSTESAKEASSATDAKKKPPGGAFAAMASLYQEGPLSVLYRALVQRHRVRVLIRYVNGIRGTLTGLLIAFDKHFNLILRDAHEVYSGRCIDPGDASNAEVEVERRLRGLGGRVAGSSSNSASTQRRMTWSFASCHQRHLRQVLVRGDTVVAVYRADQEQSAWPVTSKSPKDTIYRKQSVRRNVPEQDRVGTPGSLSYGQQRR